MTVLNTIELTKTAPTLAVIGVSCLFLAVLSFIGAILTPVEHENIGLTCVCILIFSIIGVVVCGCLSYTYTVPNGEVRYEVLINDDTSFTEVIEKYDIIEQRGEIFVLEEKE